MNRINIRAFVRDTTRWLKELPLIVTVRGVEDYIVLRLEDNTITVDKDIIVRRAG